MDHSSTHPVPSIQVAGLTAGYSPARPVLVDLTARLRGPGIIRLDAPNGSGKSTFIEAASGYLRPSAGSIRISGHEARTSHARVVRRVCRATPALHPHLSLVDHLALGADLAGTDRAAAVERARRFGLEEWFGSRTTALSTGTTRKLWYLLCTMGDFSVALLDEPFNGVDRESTALMVEELNHWAERALIVLVGHTLPDGLGVAARWSLRDGDVAQG